MSDFITESEMDFISDDSFHIEKSTLYTDLGKGIKSVEFIRVMDDNLLLLEARKSFPNPNNPSTENLAKYQSEINEICDKFIHSLNLLSSVEVGVADYVYTDDFVLPERVSLILVLVVKNHEFKQCKPIREKIIETLPSYLKSI